MPNPAVKLIRPTQASRRVLRAPETAASRSAAERTMTLSRRHREEPIRRSGYSKFVDIFTPVRFSACHGAHSTH